MHDTIKYSENSPFICILQTSVKVLKWIIKFVLAGVSGDYKLTVDRFSEKTSHFTLIFFPI